MNYIITNKEEVKRAFFKAYDNDNTPLAILAALGAIKIGPEEESGWVKINDSIFTDEYHKGKYKLIWYPSLDWSLVIETSVITTVKPSSISPTEAQAWADREIEKREAKEELHGWLVCKEGPDYIKDGYVLAHYFNQDKWILLQNHKQLAVLDESAYSPKPNPWKWANEIITTRQQSKPFGPGGWVDDWM